MLWTFIVAATLFSQAAVADQKDPRLNELFQKLHEADTIEESLPIQHGIWQLWLQSGSPTVDLLMSKGSAAMEEQDADIALTMFNAVVELKPEYAEGWNKRATLFYMMGRNEESLKDIDRVLKLEPRHFGALSGLGLVHMAMKHPSEALKAMQRALDANPHLPNMREQIDQLKKKVEGEKI